MSTSSHHQSSVALMIAEGLEEIEALTVSDLLRRVNITCDLISIANTDWVTSSHHLTFMVDKKLQEVDLSSYDAVVLPGGLPGTTNLMNCEPLLEEIKRREAHGELLAAICAAPSVFAEAGVLKGKQATCHPSVEQKLIDGGARLSVGTVVQDGHIITSRGMGTAIDFALHLVAYFLGSQRAEELAASIVYTHELSV